MGLEKIMWKLKKDDHVKVEKHCFYGNDQQGSFKKVPIACFKASVLREKSFNFTDRWRMKLATLLQMQVNCTDGKPGLSKISFVCR